MTTLAGLLRLPEHEPSPLHLWELDWFDGTAVNMIWSNKGEVTARMVCGWTRIAGRRG